MSVAVARAHGPAHSCALTGSPLTSSTRSNVFAERSLAEMRRVRPLVRPRTAAHAPPRHAWARGMRGGGKTRSLPHRRRARAMRPARTDGPATVASRDLWITGHGVRVPVAGVGDAWERMS